MVRKIWLDDSVVEAGRRREIGLDFRTGDYNAPLVEQHILLSTELALERVVVAFETAELARLNCPVLQVDAESIEQFKWVETNVVLQTITSFTDQTLILVERAQFAI